MGYERLIATNKIKNMIVVETPDSVFVSDMESSRDVKSIVEKLKQKGRSEYQKHKTSYYPWGTSTVLEMNDDCKVEKLILYPGSELKIKPHSSIIKHLVVIRGSGKMISDNQSRLFNKGESVILSESQTITLENHEKELLNIISMTLDF